MLFRSQNYQYWVYSDLTIDGTLLNYGQVLIANGSMIMGASGSFQNYGSLGFVSFNTGLTPSYNDSLKLYNSFIADNKSKFAVLPDETNNEYFDPSHEFH